MPCHNHAHVHLTDDCSIFYNYYTKLGCIALDVFKPESAINPLKTAIGFTPRNVNLHWLVIQQLSVSCSDYLLRLSIWHI